MQYFSSLALLLISFTPILSAQERALDTVVVSASLRIQHEKESGRNIISISGEEIRKLPATTLDEVLKFLPGIEVQQRGPQGSQADIVIRGGTFQQVLVLIDGLRLNDPLTGHFSGYIPIHPAEIERIEILKGAAAAIHGSDAIGGVIHIITQKYPGNLGSRSHTELEFGQFGMRNTNTWWRTASEKQSFSIGIIRNRADGQPLRGTTGFYDNKAASIAYTRTLSDKWRLALRSTADDRNFNAQNFYTTFSSDTAREKITAFWQQLNLVRQSHNLTLHIDAAYKSMKDEFLFRPSASPNLNRTRLFVGQVYAIINQGKMTTYTAGLQWIGKRIRSNDRGNHDLPHAAAYLIANHRLPCKLHLQESLRLDWDGNYGWVVVPQFNLAWNPSRLGLRASAGKGIRDADFTERFNNANKTLVTSGSIGNPDLLTERSWSYEIGADYRLNNWFKISSTLFLREQQDLIDWTPTPYAQMPNKNNLVPTGTYALATNLSNVRTSGLEMDMSMRRQWGSAVATSIIAGKGRSFRKGRQMERTAVSAKEFIGKAGWIWMQSVSGNATPSFYISSHARFLLNTSLFFRSGPLQLSLTTLYKTRQPQQAAAIKASLSRQYLLASIRIGYRINHTRATVFVNTYNLLNQNYSDLLGATMPGRWISAGIRLD